MAFYEKLPEEVRNVLKELENYTSGKVILNETLIEDGKISKGLVAYNGRHYQDGQLLNGKYLFEDKLYENGQIVKGISKYKGKHYQDGSKLIGNYVIGDTLYSNGFIFIDNELTKYQGRYYKNGKPVTDEF